MNELAATFGEGKLLIFQPALASDTALVVGLGLQRFWAQALRDAGRPAFYFVSVGKVERAEAGSPLAIGDKLVLPQGPALLEDPAVAGLLLRFQARWGLSWTFELQSPRFTLRARLVEADGQHLGQLADWTIEDEVPALIHHSFEILHACALRTGIRPPWSRWQELYGATDEAAVAAFLAAVGLLSYGIEGQRLDPKQVFVTLERIFSADPRMPHALDVAARLFAVLAEQGVPELDLARHRRELRQLGVQLDLKPSDAPA
jgi:hypothetical protein